MWRSFGANSESVQICVKVTEKTNCLILKELLTFHTYRPEAQWSYHDLQGLELNVSLVTFNRFLGAGLQQLLSVWQALCRLPWTHFHVAEGFLSHTLGIQDSHLKSWLLRLQLWKRICWIHLVDSSFIQLLLCASSGVDTVRFWRDTHRDRKQQHGLAFQRVLISLCLKCHLRTCPRGLCVNFMRSVSALLHKTQYICLNPGGYLSVLCSRAQNNIPYIFIYFLMNVSPYTQEGLKFWRYHVK